MKNSPRRGFDISKVGSPLHFFSLVAYVVSVAILYWALFPPSALTPEYISFVQNLSDKAKAPVEVIDEGIQQEEIVSAITKISKRHAHGVLMELLDRLTATSQASSASYPNLAGEWRGVVNGNDQIVEIKQHGPLVFLTGTALDDTGTVMYTFKGEGRVVLNILAFSWQIGPITGINIMTVAREGNVLDGKYFNQFGASGYERYDRANKEQSGSARPA